MAAQRPLLRGQRLKTTGQMGEWREAAVAAKRPVTGIYFHWAGLEEIVRPPTGQYEVLEGISHSYQFCMLRQSAVLSVGTLAGARRALPSRWEGRARAPA
jgi:hypothetical protein